MTNFPIRHLDEDSPFGATFTHAAALQVTWKNYPRIATDDFVLMYVAQSPVIVTTRCEVRDGAGCIRCVSGSSRARRMKHSNVEPSRHWGRIAKCIVLRCG